MAYKVRILYMVIMLLVLVFVCIVGFSRSLSNSSSCLLASFTNTTFLLLSLKDQSLSNLTAEFLEMGSERLSGDVTQ